MTGLSRTYRKTIWLALAVSFIVGVGGVSCSKESRLAEQPDDTFGDRALLIPDQRYRIPDVESQLLIPEPVFFIDPEKPLPPERYEEYLHDPVEIVREGLTKKVAEEIEELLFED